MSSSVGSEDGHRQFPKLKEPDGAVCAGCSVEVSGACPIYLLSCYAWSGSG